MIPAENQGTLLRLIFCISMGLLFLSCQTVDYRPESSVQGISPGKAVIDPVGLKLPATFKGTLPCADCEGIHYHLDLWPDGVFHLRQTYLGKSRFVDGRGRWHKDPSRAVILLYGSHERPIQFEVKGSDTIRLLDQQGRPIQSSLLYELTSDGTLTPTDLSLELHGMFSTMADATRFEDCLTGRSYPVAMEGDYIQLERAYQQAVKPERGAPLMARFEGDITRRPAMEGRGLVLTVVVRRFIGVWPGQRCERR
jgi:copper homeostasis protein (lipoprotein)